MKLNLKVRVKNVYFWLAIIGIIITAMGATPEMFTNWEIVGEKLKELLNNPFMLFTVTIAVIGIINDPTTAGISDSEQALKYLNPKRGEK